MDMNWRDDAACIGVSIDVFFIDNKGRDAKTKLAEAKQYCDSCRVRENCLNYAMNNNIYVGIYGGISNKKRREMKRKNGSWI
jgi:WhiB family redox-sensing transcriptional regulator